MPRELKSVAGSHKDANAPAVFSAISFIFIAHIPYTVFSKILSNFVLGAKEFITFSHVLVRLLLKEDTVVKPTMCRGYVLRVST